MRLHRLIFIMLVLLCLAGCNRQRVDEGSDDEEELEVAESESTDSEFTDSELTDSESAKSGNILKDYVNTPKERANAAREAVEERNRKMLDGM